MNIIELKEKILNKSIDDSLLILTYSDNTFVADQYIDEISKIHNREKLIVPSLDQTQKTDDDIFDKPETYLYVVKTDELSEHIFNPDLYKNVIILTKKVTTEDKLNIVDIPKLQNWQIEDYMSALLPGLKKVEIQWLCMICNYNIYRLQNEADKIRLFPKASQEMIFETINNDNGYSDLTPFTVFTFTTAFLKRDLDKMAAILSDLITVDVEATGVVTILIKNIKNIIDIQLNPKATAQSLGMNYKQYMAIKSNCGIFSNDQLVNMYDFLTEIDSRLKAGELTLKDSVNHLTVNNLLVDYLTCNLMNITKKVD